jgi:hypothetical protein
VDAICSSRSRLILFIIRLNLEVFSFTFYKLIHEAFIFSNRRRSFRTASGTVMDGEPRLNQSGLWLISEENGDDNNV